MVRISTIGVVLAGLVAARGREPSPRRTTRLRARLRGSISLVAYSTPRDAYSKLIPAFQRHAGRKGHLVPAELRRLRRAGACGDRRPQGRRRRVLARAGHDLARQGGPRRQVVEEGAVPRDRHALGRRLRRPQGQPEAHPHAGTTWSSPASTSLVPNVQTSGGAKWDVIAAYGAQRKLGKSHAQSVKYLEQALRPRRLAGQERA